MKNVLSSFSRSRFYLIFTFEFFMRRNVCRCAWRVGGGTKIAKAAYIHVWYDTRHYVCTRCDATINTTAVKPLEWLDAVIFLSANCFFFVYRNVSPFSVSAFEPDFVFPLENVTVAQGRDAVFTCVVNNLGGYRVSAGGSEAGTPARVRTSFVDACFTLKMFFDFLNRLTVMLCQDLGLEIIYLFITTQKYLTRALTLI